MASTISKLAKLNLKPGFHRESTQYSEEGRWFDGDRVRFREGKPENLRGYNKFTIDDDRTIAGIGRDLITWSKNNSEKLLSVGTEKKLFIVDGSFPYDVTPIVSTVTIGNDGTTGNFSTISGQNLVYVSLTNNNTSIGDFIEFTSTSINGFSQGTNFAASAFGGPVLEVVSVVGVNSFAVSVEYASNATQSGPGQGTAHFLISTGSNDSIQGTGYGAATYLASSTSITSARAWNEAAGTSDIVFAATQWSLDTFGEDLLGVKRGNQLCHWDADASVTPQRATIVPNSPNNINSIVVSPNDRHVVALGTNEFASNDFNPMLIRWADQQDYNNWTPSISTTSGELVVVDGTEIIAGIRTRNSILIWTDNALYGLQFVGPPFTFSIQQLGSNCGLIGQHGAIAVDSAAFWMSDDNFYVFDGSVRKLDCTIRRHLYDDFNMTQKAKVFCATNSEFHEIIWLYPTESSSEPDAYVIFNYIENTWVYGTNFFTTYADDSIFDNTITTGRVSASDGTRIWNNEPDDIFTGDGKALTSFLESADFDLQDGGDIMFLSRVIPDFTFGAGTNLNFSINLKDYPADTATEKGPYTLNLATNKVDLRARGRQANVRVSTSDVGAEWRWGNMRIALQPDGKR